MVCKLLRLNGTVSESFARWQLRDD